MRDGGVGREERKENDGAPSYDTSVQGLKDTPKEEEKGSQLRRKHPGTPKQEGRGKRKRKRERERETKKEGGGEKRKKANVPSYEQASRDTPRRGEYLSVTFRNTPKGKEGRGGRVGEGRELRSRQVPMNLEQALVAATTLWRARRLPTQIQYFGKCSFNGSTGATLRGHPVFTRS